MHGILRSKAHTVGLIGKWHDRKYINSAITIFPVFFGLFLPISGFAINAHRTKRADRISFYKGLDNYTFIWYSVRTVKT